MAEPLLTPTEFAQQIKAKYPDYANVPDAELAARMLEKYPEYRDRVKVPEPSSGLLAQAGSAVGNLAVGAAKGVGQSVVGAGRLIQAVPGVTKAVDYLYGAPGLSEEAMRQADVALTAHGPAQTIGKVAEQIGEVVIPGSKLTAAGRVAATNLAPRLAPVVGETIAKYAPRAAVEAAGQATMAKVQGGNPVVGGVVGAAAPALGAAVEALPTKLKEQATKQVVQALGPAKERFKAIAEKLAPNILQRGLGGSREALQTQAASALTKAGQAIDDVLTQYGSQPVSTAPILTALETAKDAFRTTNAAGKIVEFEPRSIQQLTGLQQILTDLGPTPTIQQLVTIRRAWDKVVEQAGGFAHRAGGAIGVPLKDTSEAWAKREATGAIRELLSQEVPDLAVVNKEFTFWSQLNKVLTQTLQRTQPQGIGLGRVVAAGAGAATGAVAGSSLGPVGALSGAAALGKIADYARGVIQSPQWRFASAKLKDQLAEAIVANDVGRVMMTLTRIAGVQGSKSGADH